MKNPSIAKIANRENGDFGYFWRFFGPQIHISWPFDFIFTQYVPFISLQHIKMVPLKNIEIWPGHFMSIFRAESWGITPSRRRLFGHFLMKINLFIYQYDRLFKPDQMQSKSKLYDLPIKISFFEPFWCHPVPPVPRMGCAPKFFPKSCPLVYPSCTINISKVILQKIIPLKPPPLKRLLEPDKGFKSLTVYTV